MYKKFFKPNVNKNPVAPSKNSGDSSRTSWQEVSGWYNDTVGQEGHYYHQTVIMPKLLAILRPDFEKKFALLDLACGQGILSRQLPPSVSYVGVDAAKELIVSAKKLNKVDAHTFMVADVTHALRLKEGPFTHATIILALQNIEKPLEVLRNMFQNLQSGGMCVIILNHPCYRIPRQSSWKVDEQNKVQYRRIDRYMSSMEIPIQTHPGKGKESPKTFSFHHPLSKYMSWLKEAGFLVEMIDEWCSEKVSEGSKAKMENRSREEIPLFMAIVARKK